MAYQFSLAEIMAATGEFDEANVIGKGGEGTVYKGHLLIDGFDTIVAIKLLKSNSRDRFDQEIMLASYLDHKNVMSLIGYCDESNHKIIVYEYLFNGSLSNLLYRNDVDALKWMEFLEIIHGTARGLDYLHRGFSPEHKIIHRDVKPQNILLDESWEPKISDFGLLKKGDRVSNALSTGLKGTLGYYAPEYVFNHKVTTKVDVYAFGLVMLEVLCRKKRKWPLHDESNTGNSNVEEDDIDEWARKNIARDLRHQISPKCLDKFIDTARKCLHKDPNERPSMAEVVVMLEESLELQKNSSSSFVHIPSSSEKIEAIAKEYRWSETSTTTPTWVQAIA